MAQDIESRLALQAARGIAALQLVQNIKNAADEAQVQRDYAHVTFKQSVATVDAVFTTTVLELMQEHERKIRSLAVDDDDYGEELEG